MKGAAKWGSAGAAGVAEIKEGDAKEPEGRGGDGEVGGGEGGAGRMGGKREAVRSWFRRKVLARSNLI